MSSWIPCHPSKQQNTNDSSSGSNFFGDLVSFFENACASPSRQQLQPVSEAEPQNNKRDVVIHSNYQQKPPYSLVDGLSDAELARNFNFFTRDAAMDPKAFNEFLDQLFHEINPNFVATGEDKDVMISVFDPERTGFVSFSTFTHKMRELMPKVVGNRALIIIDLQNDFVHGSLAVKEGIDVVHAVNDLRQKFDIVGLTRDWHPHDHISFVDNHPGAQVFSSKRVNLPDGTSGEQVMWPRHCVQYTEGAEFHNELTVTNEDFVVSKGLDSRVDSYSGFFDNCRSFETRLRAELRSRNVSEVFVVGLAYDYCVGFTALDAVDCGFVVYVLEDCTRAVAEDSQKKMVESLKKRGVHVINSTQIPEKIAMNPRFMIEAARDMLQGKKKRINSLLC
uniref:nicotinamidase n=1 Tax=Guillardia theta TaxID=55529 RepID=A0A6U6C165_GUITH|mmetsp:Transcript_44284/g.139697  ORF Transcript_44284/g.139697 Transcript_44284/m.139697 type:complete len:392 (+) Transcript_44284:52-1227(+)